MIVKSWDPLFKIPKTLQNCSSNGFVRLRQICAHCARCNILPVFFFHPQVSERFFKIKLQFLIQEDQCCTCEHWLLQLACRSLCIPSYRWCYLSVGSRTTTTGLDSRTMWKGTAPAVLWVASNVSVSAWKRLANTFHNKHFIIHRLQRPDLGCLNITIYRNRILFKFERY